MRVALDAQHRQIRVGVVTENARRQDATVEERDVGATRALHHVAVGDGEPVRGDDDAGARAAGRAVASLDVDAQHAGPDRVHHVDDRARIVVEEQRVR